MTEKIPQKELHNTDSSRNIIVKFENDVAQSMHLTNYSSYHILMDKLKSKDLFEDLRIEGKTILTRILKKF